MKAARAANQQGATQQDRDHVHREPRCARL